MKIEINPIKLNGSWDLGYALDKHVMSSTAIGVNYYGHTEFETQRTSIGEALYQFKYNHNAAEFMNIVDTLADFIKKLLGMVILILLYLYHHQNIEMFSQFLKFQELWQECLKYHTLKMFWLKILR